MATSKEIAQLETKLGGAALRWVLRGLPVIASFGKSEHLGSPFLRNQESDNLLLWVGLDDEDSKVFITLTYRFALTRRRRVLFLVVPCESLVFEADAPEYWTVSKDDNLPSTIIDQPNDDCSNKSLLLCMRFHMAKSRVIMPLAPVRSEVPAPAMALLRKFKLLSEASTFRLFATHDVNVAEAVHRIQSVMKGPRVTTPDIELSGLYLGNRNANFDIWEEQGWCEEEAKHHTPPRSGTPQLAPPPYPVSTSTSSYSACLLSSLSPLAADAKSSSPTYVRQAPLKAGNHTLSMPKCQASPSAAGQVPSIPTRQEPSRYIPSGKKRKTSAPPPRYSPRPFRHWTSQRVEHGLCEGEEDMSDGAIQTSTRTPQPLSSQLDEHPHNHPDFLSAEEGQEERAIRYMDHDENKDIYHAKRGYEYKHEVHPEDASPDAEPSPGVEVEIERSFKSTTSEGPLAPTPCTPKTPMFNCPQTIRPLRAQSASSALVDYRVPVAVEVPLASDSYEDVAASDPPKAPIAVHIPVTAEVSAFRDDVTTTRPQPPLPTADKLSIGPPPQHYLQMPAWLVHAWSLCPYAHYLFVTELLKLGAASFDSDPTTFNAHRANANTLLFSHWARDLHEKPSCNSFLWSHCCATKKHHVETEMSALFHWVLILDSQADLDLSGNMKALASARQMFLTCDSAHEDECYGLYLKAKAWLVTMACRFIGADGARSDKDIASKMQEEMKRVGQENQAHRCAVKS